MTAAVLLQSLQTRGFRLQVESDQLIVSPASDLTDGDRAAIREHKPEILAALRPERGGFNSPFVIRSKNPPTICFFDQCRDRLFREGDQLRCRRCGSYFQHLPLEPEDALYFQSLRSEASGGASDRRCVTV